MSVGASLQMGCAHGLLLSSENPSQLHEELVGERREPRLVVADGVCPAAIPNHEYVGLRPDRPAEAIVDADLPRLGVVLREARENQVRREGVDDLGLQQALHEVSERQMTEVIFRIELQLDASLRMCPRHETGDLRQPAVEELPKPDSGTDA